MNIALIADDGKKELMVQFCIAYCGILAKHDLNSTFTTGRLISEATGLNIRTYLHSSQGCQQLDARLRTECVLERADLRADCASWEDADIRGLDDVKNKITCICGNAVVCDLIDTHELLGGLPTLIFLLLFHVGSSHSKTCCSVM